MFHKILELTLFGLMCLTVTLAQTQYSGQAGQYYGQTAYNPEETSQYNSQTNYQPYQPTSLYSGQIEGASYQPSSYIGSTKRPASASSSYSENRTFGLLGGRGREGGLLGSLLGGIGGGGNFLSNLFGIGGNRNPIQPGYPAYAPAPGFGGYSGGYPGGFGGGYPSGFGSAYTGGNGFYPTYGGFGSYYG